MDEEKSRLTVIIVGIVLAIIFYIAFKRSLDLKTDYAEELLNVVGTIVKVILMGVGFIVLVFVTSGYAQSGAKNIRAFFVMTQKQKDWCEDVDAFMEKDRKDKATTEDRFEIHKSSININTKNGGYFYKNILEIRDFIGIDAQKAQADAEKAIEDSVLDI